MEIMPWNLHRKKFFLRYDTIRYDTVCLRALKSWRDGQFNLAYGTETKNNKENKKNKKNQKPSSLVETVGAIVREGSTGGRSETTGGRICETGRF